MKPYKAMAHIHSLNGELREVTVLEQKDSVNYIDRKSTRLNSSHQR